MVASDVPVEIVTRGAVLIWDPRGFVKKVTKDGAEYTLADAEEDFEAAKTLARGEARPLLVDERGLRGADQNVRKFWVSPQIPAVCKCVAVITGSSPVSNMIGNFVITVSKPAVPTKLFNTEQAAMPWIEWFLDDDHDSPPPSIRFR
jgi:hypothetical protein